MALYREYIATVKGKDPIRVSALDMKDAIRQIADRCMPGETFTLNGSVYVVNSFMSLYPATKLTGRA